MSFSPLLKQLIEAFRVLPGVGPKSAQRMAFYLLERDREGGKALAQVLGQALKQVGHCETCRTLCEKPICLICADLQRDHSVLCVVGGPAHVAAIEQTGGYFGLYFVLSGHLSPIDGIGPQEIGVDTFTRRLSLGTVKEVVLATNSTVEGEATAYYLADLVKSHGIKVTRIAHGVPMGGELDYIDGGTLAKALIDRTLV
ncbi:MAG: recombination protein RecR [Proteobacteria bacterium]|nr:recombination protein RecR [Pseudomonadota bacterium]